MSLFVGSIMPVVTDFPKSFIGVNLSDPLNPCNH